MRSNPKPAPAEPVHSRPAPCATCPLRNIANEETRKNRMRFGVLYGRFCDRLRDQDECFHDPATRARTMTSKPKQRLSDYSVLAQRCIMLFEGLRRLGFQADDIYFVVGTDAATVVLKTQGREFTIHAGALADRAPEHLMDEWRAIGAAYNAGAFEMSECTAVFERTFSDLGGSASLVATLLDHGFVFPRDKAN